MLNDMECPYCEAEQEVCHDDGEGYSEDVAHEHECTECGKTFVFYTEISFDYTPQKADCLNDGEHEFKATHTSPVKYSRMRCTMCEEERQPTAEELQAIFKERGYDETGNRLQDNSV